jgi:hypothetical protein
MKFKTNSTPITADTTEDARIERISQSFRPDPAGRCLNRPCDLSELMTRDSWPWLKR